MLLQRHQDVDRLSVEDAAVSPGDEILEAFGVRMVAPLSGRINRHWLVESRGERLVLKRWTNHGDDIDFELRL